MPSNSEITRFICLFHGADHARAAVNALNKLDFVTGPVSTLEQNQATSQPDLLDTLGIPARDHAHLLDGLRAGGVLVSLEAPEDRTKEIEGIFHHYTADKIDETELQVPAAEPVAAPLAASSTNQLEAETVIPVTAEELVVGKREVDRGGVRVFSRTVETPVEQDIDLHSERVVLAYREVNRPATDADIAAGAQEIELTESAEVPVVEKRARVVEEVHVGKVETERTEVVRDNVRHTEVEVESLDKNLDTDRDTDLDRPFRG